MKKRNTVVLSTGGIPCPRCKAPTIIQAHKEIRDIERSKKFYYSKWYYCKNKDCKTTLIFREEDRVLNNLAAHKPETISNVRPFNASEWQELQDQLSFLKSI